MGNIVRNNYDRIQPSNDYMKYWRVIRYWAKAKYKVGTPDIDMLLFLYSEQIFNKTSLKNLKSVCPGMSQDFIDFLMKVTYRFGVSEKVRKQLYTVFHIQVSV